VKIVAVAITILIPVLVDNNLRARTASTRKRFVRYAGILAANAIKSHSFKLHTIAL